MQVNTWTVFAQFFAISQGAGVVGVLVEVATGTAVVRLASNVYDLLVAPVRLMILIK